MSKIRVKDIIGAEVRSRIPIAALKEAIARDGCYDIDMAEVTFISRSFADELYNLQLDHTHVQFINAQGNVKKMMEVVWKGRKKKRVRTQADVKTVDLTSIEDFSNFLLSI